MSVSEGANTTYVEGEFGGPVVEVDKTLDVGTTASRLVDNNPEAVSLTLLNVGSADLYVGLDDSVTATHGILLIANGGLLSLSVRDDQGLPARAWWGVAGATGGQLYTIRNYRYALTQPYATE